MLRRAATFFFLFLVVVLVHGLNMNAVVKRQIVSTTKMMAATTSTQKINPRDERRRILKSENYNRMGFKEEKQDVAGMMASEFTSPLIGELRKNNGVLKRGDVTGKRSTPTNLLKSHFVSTFLFLKLNWPNFMGFVGVWRGQWQWRMSHGHISAPRKPFISPTRSFTTHKSMSACTKW